MQRALRRILVLAIRATAILSLVVALATSALWIRSSTTRDNVVYTPAGQPCAFRGMVSARGRIAIVWVNQLNVADDCAQLQVYSTSPPIEITLLGDGQLPSAFDQIGIQANRYRPEDYDGWDVIFPHGLLVALTAALPLSMVIRRFRRRRAPGCCMTCGYDLRATPDRCPECGAVPARTS
jgi:hypothetical protein